MPLDDIKSVEQLAADIKADHAKATDAVKEIAEKALAEAEKGVKSSASLKEVADEQLLKMNELTEQITSIEQKLARAKEFDERAKAAKSIGQQFVEAEDVKSLLDSDVKRGKAQMLLKATITSATTDTDGAAGAAVEATRLPGVVADPNRRMTIRDLLMPGQMDGSTLEYVQETGFNNNAAPVAEGAAKPQSDIKLALISTTAKVIAHTSKASRQILDDASQLRSYIDGRLRYGLAFKEELQLLSGDGTGQNLLGIIPQATAYSPAFAPAAETVIDKLRLAMLQAALAEYPATGHVMNPIDWARVETTKDSEGRYIIGNPGGEGPASLWKLPVVETQAIAVDKFLTGAFRLGAQVFDRWQARVELATENEDDFVKNMVTMLCEERLALAVYRPEAFIYGDLGFVA
ncbi:phage major capsid protein [Pseudooceanicola nitratireducens]|uniref:phage major capsid protein n=1 Tax=Pseudooceanicola nitratireducens TaxID=517719 RepID=UPI003C7EC768